LTSNVSRCRSFAVPVIGVAALAALCGLAVVVEIGPPAAFLTLGVRAIP
jgi:hypothetical protein